MLHKKRPKFQIGLGFFFSFRSQLQVIEDGQFKLRWLIYRYLQSDHGTYERVLLQQIASLLDLEKKKNTASGRCS